MLERVQAEHEVGVEAARVGVGHVEHLVDARALPRVEPQVVGVGEDLGDEPARRRLALDLVAPPLQHARLGAEVRAEGLEAGAHEQVNVLARHGYTFTAR